jgi:DNA gyrase/topoisomerase IV subunit B
MDSEQLWETTMNPETRLLRRITISDVQAAEASTADLMGDNSEARKLFIKNNAQFANIDV